MLTIAFKGTGYCWLVLNYKEKGSIVHQFTFFFLYGESSVKISTQTDSY